MLNVLNFTAIDFETSGLNFREDQIIEACAIRVRNGEPSAIFNTLVQPSERLQQKGLDPKVTEITGHTMDELADGMSEEQLATVLYGFVGSSTELIVAYNALFDMSFLESLYFRFPYTQNHALPHTERLQNPFIDPLTIARDRSPFPHKLGDMCKKYDIELEDAHSAYFDTLALIDLYKAMLAEDREGKWTEKPVSFYLNKAGYKRKYGEPEWLPDNPDVELYPQGAKPDIYHTKPEKRKTVPKYAPVLTNNSKKRKKIPDPIVPNDLFPIAPRLKNSLDALLDGAVTVHGDVPSVIVKKREFQTAWDYLTKERGIPEEHLSSYLDTNEDVIIKYVSEDASE